MPETLTYILGAALFFAILWIGTEQSRVFATDNHNPYRRYCLLCRQQQDVQGMGHDTYWASTGNLKDESCKCHDYCG